MSRPRKDRRRGAGVMGALLVGSVLGLCSPVPCSADLHIQFLLDRSGSMWAPFQGKAKILVAAEAIRRVNRKMPEDVALGLRVYPPPRGATGTPDPGLLVPVRADARARLEEELDRVNPRGKAPLAPQLRKAMDDFPEGDDTKLLILLTDGADTQGTSFCGDAVEFSPPPGLRFLAVSLNVRDSAEREELTCLGRRLDGKTVHIEAADRLLPTLLPVCKRAYDDEVARQKRVLEEQRRLAELRSKTRMKVEFRNELDPFFADYVEVLPGRLDGEEIPLGEPIHLLQGEASILFDKALPEGTHHLSLQYRKWKNGKSTTSEEGTLDVLVREGETSFVECYPQGYLFRWACQLRVKSP